MQDRVHNDGAQVPIDKIKILWKRKPVQGKVADALTDEVAALDGGKEVEFGVMIMGGAQEYMGVPEVGGSAMDEGSGTSGSAVRTEKVADKWEQSRDVLDGDTFWSELEGFLASQVKDEGEAGKLKDLFRSAWTSSR